MESIINNLTYRKVPGPDVFTVNSTTQLKIILYQFSTTSPRILGECILSKSQHYLNTKTGQRHESLQASGATPGKWHNRT